MGSGGGGGGGYRHTAGASVIGQSAQDYDGLTFFEREKLRLTEEIAAVSGFFAPSMGVSLSSEMSDGSLIDSIAHHHDHNLPCLPNNNNNKNFENLLGSANTLNRKLEEVFGVGKEFQTVADLWGVSLVSVALFFLFHMK